MRLLSAVATAGFVVACGAVLKPPAPDRKLNIKQTGSVFESNKGYRFAVLPENGASIVRLDVRYPVGSADDPKGKEGLAHLVEHLLFDVEYTRGANKTSISAELGRVAIAWNAATAADYTEYQTVLPRSAVDEVMGLEVNRVAMGCAGLTPEIFAREREVVMNELRQRQGGSGAQLQRVIFSAIYPEGHPYRAVDSVDTMKNIELKDVCDFLANQYQQGKATIVASGDVDEDLLQRAALKAFVRLHTRKLGERAHPPAIGPQPGTVHVQADIDEPAALIATWPLPPMGSQEYRMVQAVWPTIPSVLGLWGFVWKWGHSSFSQVLGGAHAPVLAVGIYLNSPNDAGEAKSFVEKSVRTALEDLGHDREDPRWRPVWQNRIESLLARWESLDSRNAMFGDMLMFDESQGFLVGQAAELKESSPSAVREIASKWLAPARARYLVIEPSGSLPIAGGSTYSGSGGDAHATAVDGSLADQPLPAPKARPHQPPERYVLGNGLTVVLWPYGTTPLARARLVIDSGSAHEPRGADGVSQLIGASEVTPDSLIFEDRELSMLVDDLVLDIGLELRSPGLPISDEQKEYLKARLGSSRAAERTIFDHGMLAAVYGEQHPYARFPMTEDSVDKIHHDLVRDWSRTHLVAKNATLIITGQFDPELVKKHIAYNLDQVSGGSDSADIDAELPSAIPKYVTGTAIKPSPTVELDVFFLSARGVNANYAKRLVLEQVLDAELGKLRDKQALTYGFAASYSPRKGGGLWMISGEADASRAAEAATSLLTIVSNMRANPDAYRGSFVLARQKVLERLLVGANDSYAMAEQLSAMARFDLDDDFFDKVSYDVAQLTLSDFHAFFVKELPVGRQVFGAFGNVGASKGAVAAAKQFVEGAAN
jgi:zinc protease